MQNKETMYKRSEKNNLEQTQNVVINITGGLITDF